MQQLTVADDPKPLTDECGQPHADQPLSEEELSDLEHSLPVTLDEDQDFTLQMESREVRRLVAEVRRLRARQRAREWQPQQWPELCPECGAVTQLAEIATANGTVVAWSCGGCGAHDVLDVPNPPKR